MNDKCHNSPFQSKGTGEDWPKDCARWGLDSAAVGAGASHSPAALMNESLLQLAGPLPPRDERERASQREHEMETR